MKYISFTLLSLLLSFTSFALGPITGTTSVCVGSAITLSDTTGGGAWSSSDIAKATVDATTGIVSGVSPGTATIFYTVGASFVTMTITINPIPAPITGVTNICDGASTPLSDITLGGSWNYSPWWIATVDITTGIVTGESAGLATISYSLGTGCMTTTTVTVNPVTPAGAILGTDSVCVGSTITLSDSVAGGTWSIQNSDAIISSSGVLTGVSVGWDTVIYSITGSCGIGFAYRFISILPVPTVTATSTSICGGTYMLIADGATAYSWSPSTSLSCTICDTTIANPPTTTIYTVTGTAGCSIITTVSVDANRISGHISPVSTGLLKVWLIQFNPADSTITALDSTMACLSDGMPYYEFDDKVSGNYLVKANLLGGTPGSSGYIPTYGFSSPYWDSATTIVHSGATDTMHINMIYGTVPSGPGFISGYVVSGAGKGTSGEVPLPGTLVYLEDAITNNIITFAYTDDSGAYSFSGLANRSYITYPEVYKFYTTPSAVIALSTASETITDVNFKQHTSYGTITPFIIATGTKSISTNGWLSVYPNPANDELNITGLQENTNYRLLSVTGVSMQQGVLQQGSSTISMKDFASGIYILEMIGEGGERSIVRVVKE